MQYRIELSSTKRGMARIHLPGRRLDLETAGAAGAGFRVAISDPEQPPPGIVDVRAATANEAVWRVARALVRAVSELTGSPLENVGQGLRTQFDAQDAHLDTRELRSFLTEDRRR
jgi:hypothetical protein